MNADLAGKGVGRNVGAAAKNGCLDGERSASVDGGPYGKPAFVRKTDLLRKGRADVPWAIQPTQWVSVEKPGYESVGNIDVNQPKPITVKLKRQRPPTPER